MPALPAVCDSCGALFPSGIVVDGGTVGIHGFATGPCPRCGAMGRVPDGLYSFTGKVLPILADPCTSRVSLQRLAAVLQEAQRDRRAPDDVMASVKRDVPGIGARVAALALPKEPGAFWGLIAVLLTLVLHFLSDAPGAKRLGSDPAQVLDQLSKPAVQQVHRRVAKQKPNEQCACGSGKKFKKCCGW